MPAHAKLVAAFSHCFTQNPFQILLQLGQKQVSHYSPVLSAQSSTPEIHLRANSNSGSIPKGRQSRTAIPYAGESSATLPCATTPSSIKTASQGCCKQRLSELRNSTGSCPELLLGVTVAPCIIQHPASAEPSETDRMRKKLLLSSATLRPSSRLLRGAAGTDHGNCSPCAIYTPLPDACPATHSQQGSVEQTREAISGEE